MEAINIFTSCVKISEQCLRYYVCTVEFIKFERFKIESLKNWNLGSSLRFSEVISLGMLNIEKSHFVIKKMHAFHGRLDFRLNDSPGIKLLSLSECLVFVFFL